MKEFFNALRYDFQKPIRTLYLCVIAVFVSIAFMTAPVTPLMAALGMSEVQVRISALLNAVYWNGRSLLNKDPGAVASQTRYGSLVGIDQRGNLVVSVPHGSRFVTERLQIADIRITDLLGSAVLIDRYKHHDARIEIYPENQAVIWIRDVPINVKLIEGGHATPDPNPPTNIVDKAFASYYWRIFKGNSDEKE